MIIKIPAGGQEFDFDSAWINDPTMAEAEDIELKTGMRFAEFAEGLTVARTRSLAVVVWLSVFRAGHKWHPPGEDMPREVTFEDVIGGRFEVRLNQVYLAIARLAPEKADPTRAARRTAKAGTATTPASTHRS